MKFANNESCRDAALNRGSMILECTLFNNSTIAFDAPTDPLISIVIVSLNAPQLLAITLASLAGQSHLNRSSYEVILVDNGSNRETREFLGRLVGARIHLNETNTGFGAACNLGASMARGRYILFLNPDIEIMPGALDALVGTMQSSERVAIVGGRLLFPNGQLQEAGANFKNDAQVTYPYLRGAPDPNMPEATYRHQTGYVSGAFLMIDAKIFNRLNGFDPVFAPAYFEDTDLCVRCSRLGYRVVYEPAATAIHFESATTNSRAEVEKLLDKNRKTFRDRHASWLFSGGADSGSELVTRNFSNHELRILYIDDEPPHMDSGSGYPRSNSILRQMVALGYFVTVFPLHRGENRMRTKYRDLPREIEILGGENAAPLQTIIDERSNYYDLLWISRPHNIDIVCDIFRGKQKTIRDFVRSSIVFDAEAIFSIRDAHKSLTNGDTIFGSNLEAAIKHEIRHYPVADHVICVSEAEKVLCERFGLTNTRVLGHGLDLHEETPGFESRSGLLFVGSLRHTTSPNYDSLVWFLTNAWESIREELGDVKLTIVGETSSEAMQGLATDGVEFTGKVADLSPYVNSARVMIAPTRYAAGVPHKVHEAISRGLPSVITPLLAEQISWPLGSGYLMGDWSNTPGFVSTVTRLYVDSDLWNSVRAKGLDAIEANCSVAAFTKTLRDICEWNGVF